MVVISMKTFTYEELRQTALDWRGLNEEFVCEECSGSGVKVYGNTSTYHGGIGGSSITMGVCDHCWGSGDKHRPWPSHKEYWRLLKWRQKLEQSK